MTGVREMCDVCDTTLFNMHWVCHKCGFVVCLDCYKVKAREMEGDDGENVDDTALKEEQREWLTCSANKLSHDHDKLMLTQIIPSDGKISLRKLAHVIFAQNIHCGYTLELPHRGGSNEYPQSVLEQK